MSSGETILNNRYRLTAQQGSGGSAVIYRALDLELGRTVAIKILRPSLTSDPSFLTRFRNEARAVANLSHTNIVTVYDVGSNGATHYIVMEFVDGQDLKKLIRTEGALAIQRSLDLAVQICAGIGFAHRAGLVHADVKPQNILVTRDNHVKVSDFGIAQALTDTQPAQRQEVVWGSPHYFAPEQARGEKPSPASDVYSIGIVLFEMLTGRLPYTGATQQELALAHIKDRVPMATEFNPTVPENLAKIVYKAMSKEPAARYRMADQLQQILLAYQDRGQQQAVRNTPQVSALVPPAPQYSSAPPPVSSAQSPNPQRYTAQKGMNVFISYSSQNVTERTNLYEALGKLESVKNIWYDDALKSHGGQDWWDKILEQVRQRDLFIFVLTPQSLLSFACYLEYSYANALDKWILPVKCQPFDIPLLPPALKGKQMVNFTSSDHVAQLKQSIEDILKLGVKPTPPKLPSVPPVPYNDFSEAAAKVLNTTTSISGYDQQALFGHLEDLLQEQRTREGALILLNIMKSRNDTLLKVGNKIETLLANTNKPGFMNRLRGRWGI